MKTTNTFLLAALTATAGILIPSCGSDDYQPIRLIEAENHTELVSHTLTLDVFGEGEKYLIRGGDGNYTISVTRPQVLDFRYDGDTLVLLPASIGTAESTIADRSGNSCVLNVEVAAPTEVLTVTGIRADAKGDKLTQEETRELESRIVEDSPAAPEGRFELTFADKAHTSGSIKIYPEAGSTPRVGIFSRTRKYDENTGDSYICLEAQMAGSTQTTYTFRVTAAGTEGPEEKYLFTEDVTDQYAGTYPALAEAQRIYLLEVEP